MMQGKALVVRARDCQAQVLHTNHCLEESVAPLTLVRLYDLKNSWLLADVQNMLVFLLALAVNKALQTSF